MSEHDTSRLPAAPARKPVAVALVRIDRECPIGPGKTRRTTMCDTGDGPSCSTEKFRKARKAHLCCSCGEAISPGHRYHYLSGIWDGSAYTFKHCLRCWALFQRLVEENYPDLVDLNLDCGESWESLYGTPPPDDMVDLAFMTPAEAQERL